MKRLALWFVVGYLLAAGGMGLAAAPVPTPGGPLGSSTQEVMALTATPMAGTATASALALRTATVTARQLGDCKTYARKAAEAARIAAESAGRAANVP